MSYGHYAPYVSVAERRRKAKTKMEKLRKKGLDIQPIEIQGRKIAKSFWGKAWNEHLESFSDYANRIPRGRTYVRNGSVCHLDIQKGEVEARVSGSAIYRVSIKIKALPAKKWTAVKAKCSGQVGSILELLQGKLSSSVMEVVTDNKSGLFPAPNEIDLDCDCPDGAYMCKHIAAVLYGIGARLDTQPELLFKLRKVDHQELISADVALTSIKAKTKSKRRRISDDSLTDVFGIDISEESPRPSSKKKVAKKAKKKVSSKKSLKKKSAKKKPSRPLNSKGQVIFTSADILKLMKKFNMRDIEFSYLAGVSKLTVQNWCHRGGELQLRNHSREALEAISKFTVKRAWEELSDITGM